MSNELYNEPLLEMYIFETSQLIEQLEQIIILNEKSSSYSSEDIDQIFRIMHTIKGSSAMMLFDNIAALAHTIEDLFYFIRLKKPTCYDCSTLNDLILSGVDFIKVELEKIKQGEKITEDCKELKISINEFLESLKNQRPEYSDIHMPKEQEKEKYYIAHDNTPKSNYKNYYKTIIFFEEGCEMENIRAYTVVHNLKDISEEVTYTPEDIIDNDETIKEIREKGFTVYIKTDKSYDDMYKFFMRTIFLKDFELIQLNNEFESTDKESVLEEDKHEDLQEDLKVDELEQKLDIIQKPEEKTHQSIEQNSIKENTEPLSNTQSIISVNVSKLDKLMDLVGEIVLTEAMVTQNPDLRGLQLDNFNKASRQLHKITSELQDIVMSIRMVPLANSFLKMQRIVRDMSKKLNKDVRLEIIGETTEVDKNIIERISDPLMHLVRNAIDHGIENSNERKSKGKLQTGVVTLEGRNAGSDVLIIIKDDGRGLNKEKLLEKARRNKLLNKPENEMTDKEIYSLIFYPGFSTKDDITEFSGRGVGMDVVVKNVESIGGSVSVDSIPGAGTTITLKMPLTLAIIDGMNIKVGSSHYTIPTTAIRESFRPKETDIILDPDGNEMIMVRGNCLPILRLHEVFRITPNTNKIHEGIIIMVENGKGVYCLFADELIGEQEVVVKVLPRYLKKINGLAGCTLLGDGSISLILDVDKFTEIKY